VVKLVVRDERDDQGERLAWFDPGTEARLIGWIVPGTRAVIQGVRNGVSDIRLAVMSEFEFIDSPSASVM